MNTITPAPVRSRSQRVRSAVEMGLPDPRPVTTYSVEVTDSDTVEVTLDQPCIIREPVWALVDSITGEEEFPVAAAVTSPTKFKLIFGKAIAASIGFIRVPYMDMQVQNFSGGFVSPGAQWFRAPA